MSFRACLLPVLGLLIGAWLLSVASLRAADTATAHNIEFSNYDATLSPGESSINVEATLDEIYGSNAGALDSWQINRPLDLLIQPLDTLYKKTGLRIGVAHTMLFTQPMGGQSSRNGASGDLDFMSSWTLLGRNTDNPGRLVVTGEYRYAIGDQPSTALGPQMGTLVGPVNGFNDREWVIRDLYWIQRFFEGRFRVLFGRGDISDYMGSHWLQNSNNSFINRNFAANPAIPFPGHGPLLGISIRPIEQLYITAGTVNGYSRTTHVEVDTLVKYWNMFSMGEIGYTPTIPNLGAGRYAFGIWHMDARRLTDQPEDYGFTFIFDQNLTKNLQIFGRYGYSDGTLTNIRQIGQLGFGWSGLTGQSDDLTGIAVGLAIPRSDTTRNETTLELFHRIQVSKNNQLSFGVQLIANPGNASDNETAGVFYARLRTSF